MFGSHLSIAGGLVNALIEAQRLNMDCVQVFTRNQRQWSARPLGDDERSVWATKLKELGWHRGRSSARTVSHGSYLVNLASPDPMLWKKSTALQRAELERCEALAIRLCVIHPGAHLGAARPSGQPHQLGAVPTKDELAGLRRVVKALNQLHEELPGYRVITCLETTVGAGTTLGYDFQHLAYIRSHVREPQRVGYCFDTCHVTAAGYDMTTDDKAKTTLQQWDKTCGNRQLRVLHLNDSVGPVGSRKDRHAHIGRGQCGLSCFRAIVNRSAFDRVPKILETPKGKDDKGIPWDVVNIRCLKRMVRRQPSTR
ncbi:MAG: deoxyribonuclease IV [Phycisphaerales bacterium]